MLDLTTLYVMVSLASVVAGIVHVVPWVTRRFGAWAGWWGIGHILLGSTAAAALLREMGAPFAVVQFGNPLSVVAYAMIFIGVRSFADPGASYRPPLALAALLAVPLLFVTDPAQVGTRVGYLSVVRALFDAATALVAIGIARRVRLQTGWTVAILFGVTVPMFLGRAWVAFDGKIGTQVTGPHEGLTAWLVALPIAFILFRGFVLFILEAERGQRELTALLERDPLTGAGNRTAFERCCPAWRGDGAALMIDLDQFKPLNDRCGHAVGDAALRMVAATAMAVLGERGHVFRWGGDEFVCILPGADPDAADAAAHAIAAQFAQGVRAIAPADLSVTLSIGRAHGPLGDADLLIARADDAMYAIKARRPHRSLSGNAALPMRHDRRA